MKDQERYELKMVFDALRVDEVRSWVLSHPDMYRRAFPPRQVNNIYFDTLDLDLMAAHINGIADRAKIRYRWYGKTWIAESGQLEIKKKMARLGAKEIETIKKSFDVSKSDWKEIANQIRSSCSEKNSEMLKNTIPVLINLYYREYFVSFDGRVRITLDYDMKAFGQSFGNKPNITFQQPLNNLVIIEIKADAEEHHRVADTFADFKLYGSQFSKFLSGIENVY